MKVRSLLILLVLVSAVVPVYFLNRWMQRVLRPRESAARLFLFIFGVFVLIMFYTIFIVALIARIFPR